MQPTFEVDGAGWSVSFQRRVGTANRGALPCLTLHSSLNRIRVLVPLRVGEALWIAVTAEPAIVVSGHAGQHPLHANTLWREDGGKVLQALDAILQSDRWVALDAASLACADQRSEIEQNSLTIILKNTVEDTIREVGLVIAAPALYESLSGLPAPEPTTELNEYRGWRLP